MLTSFELVKFFIQSGVCKDLTPAEQIVLHFLASHYSDISGCSFPSQELAAERTGLTRQTVNECVKNLKAAKFIYVTKVRKCNKYTFPHAELPAYDAAARKKIADKNFLKSERG